MIREATFYIRARRRKLKKNNLCLVGERSRYGDEEETFKMYNLMKLSFETFRIRVILQISRTQYGINAIVP